MTARARAPLRLAGATNSRSRADASQRSTDVAFLATALEKQSRQCGPRTRAPATGGSAAIRQQRRLVGSRVEARPDPVQGSGCRPDTHGITTIHPMHANRTEMIQHSTLTAQSSRHTKPTAGAQQWAGREATKKNRHGDLYIFANMSLCGCFTFMQFANI